MSFCERHAFFFLPAAMVPILCQELGIPGFNAFAKRFQLQLHEVALKIFRAFALSLGWPEDYFEEVRTTSSHYLPLSFLVGPLFLNALFQCTMFTAAMNTTAV